MSNEFSVIDDMSTITTIDRNKIKKFIDFEECCIANCIHEREDGISIIDVGIGTLSILVEQNRISYKFIPSESLRKKVLSTTKGKNYVADRIEKVAKRITLDAYKDVMG